MSLKSRLTELVKNKHLLLKIATVPIEVKEEKVFFHGEVFYCGKITMAAGKCWTDIA